MVMVFLLGYQLHLALGMSVAPGDLNVTLNMDEIWGIKKNKDPLIERIKNDLLNRNLVDIIPHKMLPTWKMEELKMLI